MKNPLEAVRIVDFTHMIAGPLCTQVLADLGARVVKIEPPGGETSRNLGNVRFQGHTSYFWSFNRNKTSYVCDFADQKDLAALETLLREADVVVDNFRPGTLARLGLSPDRIELLKPDIIQCSVSGFDPADPDFQRPAVDPVIQAISGAMEVNGTLQAGPLKVGMPVGDALAPLYASTAILFALMRRGADPGKPQRINISMLGSLISAMAPHDFAYRLTGSFPQRQNNEHPQISPANTYQAADGRYVTMFAPNDKHWQAILESLGEDAAHLACHGTSAERAEHRDEIDDCIRRVIASRPASHWDERARRFGALIVPVNGLREVVSDPTLNEIYYQRLPSGAVVAKSPIRISDPPEPLLGPTDPPPLGPNLRA
ncbi:CoA transferase [Pigmentiphaga sp.]|uniref:CaiB/BaiF CoA transferase family protein n=1 Tax=Pigmentiphaga sp. TaxID=1977564 RepID=UPI0025CD5DA4|nr:CoA transferase [Pigmentiphaga sp.]